jgi:coenzyme F420-reducing hydrogenase alpha subunit
MKTLDINVHHVTRVEGHGNVVVNVRNGAIERLELQIVESPRFFEVMLEGRHITEACHITCRICGICALGHTTASLRASEAALGITPPEPVQWLRRILLNAEFIQSHILHAYFLAAPDFFGVPSVIPLAETHPEVVKRALKLKRLGNDVCEVLVGRHVHPVAMAINGFTRWPAVCDLQRVRTMLAEARPDIEETVALFSKIQIPPFTRPTEYVCLSHPDYYATYDGMIASSTGARIAPADYLTLIKERVVRHSTAKHVSGTGGSIMVGALARYNQNAVRLHPKAQAAASALGLAVPSHNPFLITVAQVVECVHCLEESIDLLDALIAENPPAPARDFQLQEGTGVGAVEVPRGILFHEYEIDKQGYIRRANCILPTGQNLANIENDMRALVPTLLDRHDDAAITKKLEMLVRAYDPCISCSSHFLDVSYLRS